MSAYFSDYPRYAWQMMTGFRVNHERQLANLRQRDLAPYLDLSRPLEVLDLANGRLRPQFAILSGAGHHVYGVDLANRPTPSWVNIAYRATRWAYQQQLAHRNSESQTLICGNVNQLPLPSKRFDLVTSIAAFEHFLDVPAVVAELHRVVRPGGMLWLCIHLFTSVSGGHNLSFAQIPTQSLPTGIDPWDHLRERKLPFHVPLNEWRKQQYLNTIGSYFDIVTHYCAIREGEHLLSPAVEAELAQYNRDELTARDYVIVARKRANVGASVE